MKNQTTYEDWLNVQTENPISKAMRRVQLECFSTLRGGTNIAIIGGINGVGKNAAVRRALTEARVKAVMSNPTDYKEFVQNIGQAQREGKAIWLDEADYVFGSLRMINILKAMVGPKSERTYAGRNVNVPHGVFLTTNSNLGDLGWADKKIRPHIDAWFSREHPIVIKGTALELWEYSVFIALTTKMLQTDEGGDGIPLDTAQRALDWFTQNVHRLDKPSPRLLFRIADMLHRSEKTRANLDPIQIADKMEEMIAARDSQATPPLTPDIRAIMATRPKYSREKINA